MLALLAKTMSFLLLLPPLSCRDVQPGLTLIVTQHIGDVLRLIKPFLASGIYRQLSAGYTWTHNQDNRGNRALCACSRLVDNSSGEPSFCLVPQHS